MKNKKVKKGFTIVEVLIAVLIVSICSAALAVSVEKASSISSSSLKIDEQYSDDLKNAQEQSEESGTGTISIDGAEHSVTYYGNGNGDLTMAGGSIAVPTPTVEPTPSPKPVTQYTITYILHGDIKETRTVNKGDPTPDLSPDPWDDGEHKYEFASWNPALAPTVTGDATYTAQWNEVPLKYTIRFYNKDKTVILQSGTYERLEYVPEPTPPEISGESFDGWSPQYIGSATKDVDYVATYRKSEHPNMGAKKNAIVSDTTDVFSILGTWSDTKSSIKKGEVLKCTGLVVGQWKATPGYYVVLEDFTYEDVVKGHYTDLVWDIITGKYIVQRYDAAVYAINAKKAVFIPTKEVWIKRSFEPVLEVLSNTGYPPMQDSSFSYDAGKIYRLGNKDYKYYYTPNGANETHTLDGGLDADGKGWVEIKRGSLKDY